MGTAAIVTGAASIAGLQAAVAQNNAKKAELEALLSSLRAFDATIEYVLKNHSHIKWTYFLAGTKYAQETQAVQDAVKNEQRNLMTHVDNACDAVEAEIKNVEARISSLNASIKVLEASKKKR